MPEDIYKPAWAEHIRPEQWSVYRAVIVKMKERGIPFALGGAFANAVYMETWRDTKDLDVYVLPKHRQEASAILLEAGLLDYYSMSPYDRSWIFRGIKDGEIVDVIWGMANHSAGVDQRWLEAGPRLEVRDEVVNILPVEELLWARIFVLQRDRSDWPDILNMLYYQGASLDWQHLLNRLGDQAPLMAGVLSVLGWLAPGAARQIPEWVWGRLGLARPVEEISQATQRYRAALLDSREWFAGLIPGDEMPRW